MLKEQEYILPPDPMYSAGYWPQKLWLPSGAHSHGPWSLDHDCSRSKDPLQHIPISHSIMKTTCTDATQKDLSAHPSDAARTLFPILTLQHSTGPTREEGSTSLISRHRATLAPPLLIAALYSAWAALKAAAFSSLVFACTPFRVPHGLCPRPALY